MRTAPLKGAGMAVKGSNSRCLSHPAQRCGPAPDDGKCWHSEKKSDPAQTLSESTQGVRSRPVMMAKDGISGGRDNPAQTAARRGRSAKASICHDPHQPAQADGADRDMLRNARVRAKNDFRAQTEVDTSVGIPAGRRVRNSKYRPEYASMVRDLLARGESMLRIAKSLGVSPVTMWGWRVSHAEFDVAVEAGLEKARRDQITAKLVSINARISQQLKSLAERQRNPATDLTIRRLENKRDALQRARALGKVEP